MFVCICNGLKEQQLRDVARRGAANPARAYRSLGCQVKCGQCVPFARDVIGRERSNRTA